MKLQRYYDHLITFEGEYLFCKFYLTAIIQYNKRNVDLFKMH